MNDYVDLLTLSYFKQYKEKYVLKDLAEILGIDFNDIDILIDGLINRHLLLYNGYLLEITKKGMMMLISNDMNNYDYQDEKIIYKEIDPTKAWDIYKPYVPEGFMKKVN